MATNLASCFLFNFRTTPKVSSKLFFVEISQVSEKLRLFNYKRNDFLASKFWIFFHFAASLKFEFYISKIGAPDQKQNRKIVITSTDQITQYIIRNYEARSLCMAESGLEEPWIKVMTLYFQVQTNKPSL